MCCLSKAQTSHQKCLPVHKAVFGPGAGIKAQVCSLVELLVTTLFQAYAVFYLPPEGGPRPGEGALSCGMLFSILENVTSTTPAGKQLGCSGSKDTFRDFLTESYLKQSLNRNALIIIIIIIIKSDSLICS